MNKSKFILQWLFMISFGLAHLSFGLNDSTRRDQEIISWIKQNAIPLKHIEAGNGFSAFERNFERCKISGSGGKHPWNQRDVSSKASALGVSGD